jgi:hypothetical protein
VSFYVGEKVLIERVQVPDLVRLLPISVMPVISLAAFVVVPDKVLTVPAIEQPVLVAVTAAG